MLIKESSFSQKQRTIVKFSVGITIPLVGLYSILFADKLFEMINVSYAYVSLVLLFFIDITKISTGRIYAKTSYMNLRTVISCASAIIIHVQCVSDRLSIISRFDTKTSVCCKL